MTAHLGKQHGYKERWVSTCLWGHLGFLLALKHIITFGWLLSVAIPTPLLCSFTWITALPRSLLEVYFPIMLTDDFSSFLGHILHYYSLPSYSSFFLVSFGRIFAKSFPKVHINESVIEFVRFYIPMAWRSKMLFKSTWACWISCLYDHIALRGSIEISGQLLLIYLLLKWRFTGLKYKGNEWKH